MPRHSRSCPNVIAPNLRGFGASDSPGLPPFLDYTPELHAYALASLINHLGWAPAVVVAHDIGATIAQPFARRSPHQVRALVLLNTFYPGIGSRRFEPQAQREFWSLHFHQLPLADELNGHSREAVDAYLCHFYRHWSGRRDMMSDRLSDIFADFTLRTLPRVCHFVLWEAPADVIEAV